MSASSGIGPSAELVTAWQDAQSNSDLRVLCVIIEKEQLVPGQTLDKSGSDVEDYDQLQSLVEPNAPAYLLFRLDEGGWLLVVYVPDIAPVRQKMLYASTRASLTRSLGDSYFSDSLHAHSTADLTTKAYKAHLAHSSSEAPLTEREQELASLKEVEGIEARGTAPRGGAFSTSSGTTGGLAWDEMAQEAVRDLAERREGAVHLVLDVPRETVILASRSARGQLAVPTDSPSYSLIAHSDAIALVYCCPSKSPVKSRLLYSASVRGIQQRVGEHGLAVTKRLETSDPAEITPDWLDSELGVSSAPASAAASPATIFSRPKRPGRPSTKSRPTPDAQVALPEQTIEGEAQLP